MPGRLPPSRAKRFCPPLLAGLLAAGSLPAAPGGAACARPAMAYLERAATAVVAAPPPAGLLPAAGGPTLQIEDLAAGEGQSDSRAYGFIVRLSHASSRPVSVRYATVAGTAQAGVDFVETAGTLTFLPGQTSKQITVQFKGDTVREANETLFVRLSQASGATVSDATGLGIILNDDGPVLKINHVAQLEGDSGLTRFNFAVSLSEKCRHRVTVRFATANGQALAGSDYAAHSGWLTFFPGQTSQTIAITVRGDTTKEPNEAFYVTLSEARGASLYTNQGIGTIRNDDGQLTRLTPPGHTPWRPVAAPPAPARNPAGA